MAFFPTATFAPILPSAELFLRFKQLLCGLLTEQQRRVLKLYTIIRNKDGTFYKSLVVVCFLEKYFDYNYYFYIVFDEKKENLIKKYIFDRESNGYRWFIARKAKYRVIPNSEELE